MKRSAIAVIVALGFFYCLELSAVEPNNSQPQNAKFKKAVSNAVSEVKAKQNMPNGPALQKQNNNAVVPPVLAQQFPNRVNPFFGPGIGQQQLFNNFNTPQDNAQELINLIHKTISPSTWDVNGGQGTVQYFRIGHALVIRAPGEVHEEISDVLPQLRN